MIPKRKPRGQAFAGQTNPARRKWDMISRQAKYALRALIALARIPPGQSMLTAEIARRQKIPKKFLEQILLVLKRRGLVQSRRGSLGGYALLKPADTISFAEVLRLIDGPMAPLPCLSVVAYARCIDCTDEKACEIRRAFALVADATREVLERTTIGQAIAGDSEGLTLVSAGEQPTTV